MHSFAMVAKCNFEDKCVAEWNFIHRRSENSGTRNGFHLPNLCRTLFSNVSFDHKGVFKTILMDRGTCCNMKQLFSERELEALSSDDILRDDLGRTAFRKDNIGRAEIENIFFYINAGHDMG
ncbi:MAG: hypothetical protein BWY09_00030 [Candidatus Hydrogenedentes bacterium ADurb.Bin179]|nr:MAG: hypothetical protein BWY09_00030 [Candidatus Hydrogenedentes bacterium ADurb.Bin179]